MATRKISKKETLGRYRILREIGRGGSGVVYEGWDPRENRRVALKVLPAIRALDAERVHRFLREAETARQLQHVHIISLYEIGEERGTYFLVMQYVDGRPLDVFWKEELIDFRASVSVVIQCLEALAYAHEKNLVHLDVKPQNILVDKHGKAFLTDFGLAQGVSVTRKEGAVTGTPKYMSPEQAAGQSNVDFRSDIYSLGVTLYNLLTYTHPFEGEEVHLILKNVIAGDFQRPRDINNRIPTRLEAIVLKAMECKPGRRYQTAAEFRADLENYLKGESVTASVPIMKRRGIRLLGTRHVLVGFLALAVTAVAVLITLETLFQRSSTGSTGPASGLDRRREARDLSAEGDRKFQEGRLEEALQAYNRALQIAPNDPITLVKRGQIYARRSAFKRAESDFTSALEADPAFELALLNRGQVRIELDNFEGARSDLEKAHQHLAAKSDDPDTPRFLSECLTALGQWAFETGDFPGARRFLEEAQGHDAQNPRTHLLLGLSHMKEGNRSRAFEEIKKVTELEPTNQQAKQELERVKLNLEVVGLQVQIPILQASAHLNQGKYRQTIQYCQEALKIEPTHAEALIIQARAKIALGKPQAAYDDLTAVLERGEEESAALTWRARALAKLGRFQEAITDARAALRASPEIPEALRELGLAHAAIHQKAKAIQALEAALAKLPGDVESLEILADLYLDSGQFPSALQAATSILNTVPHNVRALEIHALANLKLGRRDEALKDAERALAIDPDLSRAHYVRASVLLEEGKPRQALESAAIAGGGTVLREEALRLEIRALTALGNLPPLIDACSRLLEIRPGDPETLLTRGRSHLETGALEKAEKDYRALCTNRPRDSRALLGLARTLMRNARPEEAFRWAEQAASVQPDPKAQGIMGWALLVLRRYEDALPPLLRAVNGLSPEGAEAGTVLVHAARALRALGRPAEALPLLEKALRTEGGGGDAGFLKVEVLLDLGREKEAEKAWTGLGKDEKGAEARWVKARLLLHRGEGLKALGQFQALEPGPPSGPVWGLIFQGASLLKIGRPLDALRPLSQAVQRDPNLAAARFHRARVHSAL
ncbi:MAG: protein kinase domain-containing protein, partial [Planctomycetota bacterium]